MIAWLGIGACEREAPVTTTPPAEAPVVRCGDGVPGAGEACDDGNTWGGDGCLPDCTIEPDPLEIEPNDTWDAANPWTMPVYGGLPEGDVDCFAFDVPDCAAIAVTLDCPASGVLALHDPNGIVMATGSGGADVCPAIDPARAPGARFADAGTYAVCVSSLTGAAIPAYALDIAWELGAPYPIADDPDGDGLPDRCDDDDDADGLLDPDDNCPDTSNGPASPPLAVDGDGWIEDWLVLAPITGTASASVCLPSADELPGGDASLAPELGDPGSGLVWTAALDQGAVFDFLPSFGFVYAPREVYVHAYVTAPTARDVTLAVGADDGVRAWVNGEVVLDIATCQGVNLDQFQAPVHLDLGANRLTLKVRDQGGGWGQSVRFLDAGVPVADLTVSLSADPAWVPDQTDTDQDGIGDLCDPTPSG